MGCVQVGRRIFSCESFCRRHCCQQKKGKHHFPASWQWPGRFLFVGFGGRFFPRRMRPGLVPVPVTSLHFHRQIIFATVPVVPTVPFETYPRRSCVFHPSSNGVLKPCRDLCSSKKKKEQQTCACAVEIQQLACANCKSGPVSHFAPTPGAGALLRTHQSRFAKQCCWISTPSFGRFGWENNARHGLLFPLGVSTSGSCESSGL